MRSPVVIATASPAPVGLPGNGHLFNGFHVACLAFQRARQLRDGGRPRLDGAGHKYLWVAMNEVRAGLVAWDVKVKVDQDPT